MMDIERLMGSAHSVKITQVKKENASTSTLEFEMQYLDGGIGAGQFLMIWVPGIDEIPMSVSLWNAPKGAITIKAIGEATNHLINLGKGDWIGIRGPFGNKFSTNAKRALIVGGGIGIAPLRPLVYDLLQEAKEVHLIAGAKSKDELILYDFEQLEDDKDLLMEQILENINNTPIGLVLKKIASLPEIRRKKVLNLRKQINTGKYDLNRRLDVALDRVLEELTT